MFSDVAVRRELGWILSVLIMGIAAACAAPATEDAAQTDATADANVAAARRLLEEPWNNNNMAVLTELHAPDMVSYSNGVRDTLTAEAFIQATKAQYPDGRVQVVESFGTGDRVVTHWTYTATASPATNQGTIHGASIGRWVDGKLAESHNFYDLLAFTLATGATLTPPAGTAPTTTTGQ